MPGFLKAIREAAAAAPVNQDLVFTRRKLWDDIERTLWALETAQNHFEQATEPSLIDCYIYEWNAAQLRYQFLLRKFKNMDRGLGCETAACGRAWRIHHYGERHRMV